VFNSGTEIDKQFDDIFYRSKPYLGEMALREAEGLSSEFKKLQIRIFELIIKISEIIEIYNCALGRAALDAKISENKKFLKLDDPKYSDQDSRNKELESQLEIKIKELKNITVDPSIFKELAEKLHLQVGYLKIVLQGEYTKTVKKIDS
jgi:hypothetical protein